MADGTVMTCGNGHHGQLGHGSDLNLHDNPQARASNSNWEFPTRIKVFLHDVWPKKLQYFRDVRAIDAGKCQHIAQVVRSVHASSQMFAPVYCFLWSSWLSHYAAGAQRVSIQLRAGRVGPAWAAHLPRGGQIQAEHIHPDDRHVPAW